MPSQLPTSEQNQQFKQQAVDFVARFFNPFGSRPIFAVILFILLVSLVRAFLF